MPISIEIGHTMTLKRNIIFLLFFCVTNIWAQSQIDLESNDLNEGDNGGELLNNYNVRLSSKDNQPPERVFVQLFYEVHCPHCIHFYLNQFVPIIETMSSNVYYALYPFGNAKMVDDKGKVKVECQHGPAECYGNKLHACSFVTLNQTSTLVYNACLMNSTDGLGSDDKSADRCGKLMNIDSGRIKNCAKGRMGQKLLIIIGKISKHFKFSHVPYVLINHKVYDVKGNDFKKQVCAAFTNPPPPCKDGDML